MTLNESLVEEVALEWFEELGYTIGHGPHLAPGEPAAERNSFGEVVLNKRLREAILRINPAIPEDAREEALRKVLRLGTPSLTQTNRAFQRLLRDGVPVEYPRPDGSIAGDYVMVKTMHPRPRWNWKCWCAGCSSGAAFSICSSISSCSKKIRTRARYTKSSPATTSSMR